MFVLERDSGIPLPSQVAAHIRSLIVDGTLRAGDPVSSSRGLARDLGVSRGTVVAAYDQLIAEGYLATRPGGTTTVHADALQAGREPFPARVDRPAHGGERGLGSTTSRPENSAHDDGAIIDMRPGFSHDEVAEDSTWREAWRSAAGTAGAKGDVRGLRVTRVAISEHLRLTRSMQVDPEDIVVTGGARDGLFALLSCVGELGLRRCLAIENPGYPGLRGVIRRSGIDAVDIVTELPAEAGAALVTPNRTYPLGGSMPAGERMELLASAERQRCLIIEDDLDSQFRHVGPVMPSLWELAPGSVAHLGTFNQVLTRQVRLGYIILSQDIQGPILAFRQDLGMIPSAIAQRALATYLETGGLRRSLARRRREVIRRRRIINEALAWADVRMNAEATAIVRLGRSEADWVAAECATNGVLVETLGTYWSGGAEAGIVFSYGRGSNDVLTRGLACIRSALEEDAAIVEP